MVQPTGGLNVRRPLVNSKRFAVVQVSESCTTTPLTATNSCRSYCPARCLNGAIGSLRTSTCASSVESVRFLNSSSPRYGSKNRFSGQGKGVQERCSPEQGGCLTERNNPKPAKSSIAAFILLRCVQQKALVRLCRANALPSHAADGVRVNRRLNANMIMIQIVMKCTDLSGVGLNCFRPD